VEDINFICVALEECKLFLNQMNAHMTPTGRTFKPRQIKKTEAEVHLHQKY